MSELHPDDRKKLGQVLGMKASEIIAAVELPEADPPAAVVQTHDGQHVLVTTDDEGRPAVKPWDGQLSAAPAGGDEVAVGESGLELVVPQGDGTVVPDPSTGGDDTGADGDPDAVPAGTVEDVLAWVGENKDRAARALVVEQDADKPRKGLVDQLKKLAGHA